MIEPDDLQLVPQRVREYEPDAAYGPKEPFAFSLSNDKFRKLLCLFITIIVLIIVIVPTAVVLTNNLNARACSSDELAAAGCSPYADCIHVSDEISCVCKAGYTGSGFYCAITLSSGQENGPSAGAQSGYSLWPAGDFNGDGFADVVIGAPYTDGAQVGDSTGAVYVLFGQPGSSVPNVDLSVMNGVNGFAISGLILNGTLGLYVGGAFDINKDGHSDIIIAASSFHASYQSPGVVYVLFGGPVVYKPSFDLSTLNGVNGFSIVGQNYGDQFGASVAALGDVNGDTVDDVIIGAPGWQGSTGAAYVVFGHNGTYQASYNIANLTSTGQAFVLTGQNAGDLTGIAVSAAGDMNGDGIKDILIGAQNGGDNQQGSAYVVLGSASFPQVFLLSSLTGRNGFQFIGSSNGDLTGFAVSPAGDIDNDGLADILIGAYEASPNEKVLSGAVYVIYGSAAPYPQPVYANVNIDGFLGFLIIGAQDGDQLGVAVSPAGDFNNDGYADFLLGAFAASPSDSFHAGASYLIFGSARAFAPSVDLYTFVDGSNGFIFFGLNAGDELGIGLCSAGDFNHDGYGDLALGASSASPSGRSKAGYTLIYLGKKLT